MNKVLKTTLLLHEQQIKDLTWLAEIQGVTRVEVIRKAISLEKLIWETLSSGGKLLLEMPDGTIRQVLVR